MCHTISTTVVCTANSGLRKLIPEQSNTSGSASSALSRYSTLYSTSSSPMIFFFCLWRLAKVGTRYPEQICEQTRPHIMWSSKRHNRVPNVDWRSIFEKQVFPPHVWQTIVTNTQHRQLRTARCPRTKQARCFLYLGILRASMVMCAAFAPPLKTGGRPTYTRSVFILYARSIFVCQDIYYRGR